ncbi:MAG: 50S ribosomal protein L23 [Patescibacteria group bacterium]
MALFGKKTEKKAVTKKVAKKAVAVKAVPASTSPKVITSQVIVRPRITEKAGIMGEALNVYTFEVSKTSTKHTIAHEIESLYKVVPEKVRIINLPARNVIVRGRRGTQSAVKKALVFLKKGDKIEIA